MIGTLGNAMLDDEAATGAADGRVDPRLTLFLSATLTVEGRRVPVRIRNLSVNGAMIESEIVPRAGSDVVIERTGLEIDGTVCWASGPRAGIRFRRQIQLTAWSPSLAQSSRNQSDVDENIAAIRAGRGAAPELPHVKGNLPVAELHDRIGEELRCVARMLDAAGDALAGDATMIARHGERLQEFDLAAQLLTQLADLVTATDRTVALDKLSLSDLRRRLIRTSL